MRALWQFSTFGWLLFATSREPMARGATNHADETTVNLRLEGAIAEATVEGPLPDFGSSSRAAELHFDILPPEGAALRDIALLQGRRWKAIDPAARAGAEDSTATAERAYNEALRAMQLERTPLDVEDDLRFRVRIAASAQGTRPTRVRYRLVIPVAVGEHDHFRVAFPAAPDSPSADARLRIEVPAAAGIDKIAVGPEGRALHADGPGALETRVDLRGSWSVDFSIKQDAARTPSIPFAGLFSISPQGPKARVAYTARAGSTTSSSLPSLVLFVVDRSRSVGTGGLAVERDMLHEVLDHLPRSTRFQVLFFDRSVKPLFKTSRAATGEALSAVDEAMLPDALENGSDLLAAATVAGETLRSQAALDGGATWLVLLTDGAFANPITESNFARAFGTLPGPSLGVAAWAVRAREDARFPETSASTLRAFGGGTGAPFVARLFRENERREGVAAALANLQAGGDLTQLRAEVGSSQYLVRAALSPGQSTQGLLDLNVGGGRESRAAFVWQRGGHRESWSGRLQRVDAEALGILSQPPAVRASATPWLAALVEPLMAPPPPPLAAPVQGNLERSVVRDHLSLRFLPRARACYQRRIGPTRALRDLEGRVRLALDLARGELTGMEVLSSSLGRGDDGSPAITTASEQVEVDKVLACLREAAFAIDVPPTYMNDQGVRAVLNLHFHPYRQEKHGDLDSELARELDVILESTPAAGTATHETAQVPAPRP